MTLNARRILLRLLPPRKYDITYLFIFLTVLLHNPSHYSKFSVVKGRELSLPVLLSRVLQNLEYAYYSSISFVYMTLLSHF